MATFIALTIDGLVGWVIDPEDPSGHKEYTVTANGSPIGAGRNDGIQDRSLIGHPDYKQLQEFGFRIPIAAADLEFPLSLVLNDPAGNPTQATLHIPSGERLDPATLRFTDNAFEGFFDGFFKDGLGGWVWVPSWPTLKIIVEIKLAGELLVCTVADTYRADLDQAGKGNGSCSFFASLPVHALKRYNEISVSVFGFPHILPRHSADAFTTPAGHDLEEGGLSAIANQLTVELPSPTAPHCNKLANSVVQLQLENRSIIGELTSLSQRVAQQETYRAALQGTVDNLVRAWLEQREMINRLQALLVTKPVATASALTPLSIAPAPVPKLTPKIKPGSARKASH